MTVQRAATRRRRITGRAQTTRELLTNPKLVFGLIVVAFFGVLAVAHPILMNTVWRTQQQIYRPIAGHDPRISHPSGPSLAHPLGTDAVGTDVVSQLTFNMTHTMVLAVVVAVSIGVTSLLAGTVAAYFRGKVDGVVSVINYGMVLLPAAIVLLVVGFARPDFGPVPMGLVYGMLYGLGPAAIVVRSRALTVMEKPFVEVSRIAGGQGRWIIGTHLVPHVLPFVAVQAMAGVTGALIVVAFVEFVAASQTATGLGGMIYVGLTNWGFVGVQVPWGQLLSGALSISALAGSFYLMSVGLREALDPVLLAKR